ncbi:MAG: succinate dehydrogenase assembly factor 2 [Gallionella sp.]|jgi:antitoxin CptB
MTTEDCGLRIVDSGGKQEQVLHPASRILHPGMLQRVRWRCRRGLLELDIVLGRFVEAHYGQLTESERQTFEEFLDMPDNPLWDLVSGRQGEVSGEQAALLEKIKSV